MKGINVSKVFIAWKTTEGHSAEVGAAEVMTDGEIDDDKVSEWVSEKEDSHTANWMPVDRDIHTARLIDAPEPGKDTPPSPAEEEG